MLRSKDVKERLIRRGWTDRELARRLGISSPYVSQLMAGVRRPGPRVRRRIMRIFPDAAFDDLFLIKPSQNVAASGVAK